MKRIVKIIGFIIVLFFYLPVSAHRVPIADGRGFTVGDSLDVELRHGRDSLKRRINNRELPSSRAEKKIMSARPVMDVAMMKLPPQPHPEKQMTAFMMSPPVADVPMKLFIHEAELTIQFEAGSDAINADSCICRTDEGCDNVEQLRMIDELLNDSTMEIVDIKIVSSASSEESHIRNIDLAKRRSKTLAEYISRRYNLPDSLIAYYYFPEDKEGFRPLATVTIRRRQKLLSDDSLMNMIKTTPYRLSLDEMYRAAGLYPEGSDYYNHIMELIHMCYPDNQAAIINIATAAVLKGEYDHALQLLERVEGVAEVYNLLGIIATSREDYETARRYFDKAGELDYVKHNVMLLQNVDLRDGWISHDYGKWMLNNEDE